MVKAHIHTDMHTYTHTQIHTQTNTHTHTYERPHIHTYTRKCILLYLLHSSPIPTYSIFTNHTLVISPHSSYLPHLTAWLLPNFHYSISSCSSLTVNSSTKSPTIRKKWSSLELATNEQPVFHASLTDCSVCSRIRRPMHLPLLLMCLKTSIMSAMNRHCQANFVQTLLRPINTSNNQWRIQWGLSGHGPLPV